MSEIKKKKNILSALAGPLILTLAAFIWGIAFVAQTVGGKSVGAFSFNCLRSFLGAAVLIPVILFLDAKGLSNNKPKTKEDHKRLWIAGVACGAILGLASALQQLGLVSGTEPGKAGFLTACYIILVPILGIFLKKHCGFHIWICVIIAIIGLYFLCMTGGLYFKLSDTLVLLCSLTFACHILTIDHFVPYVDGVRLSCLQFLFAGIFNFIPMVWVDMHHSIDGFMAWIPTLCNEGTIISLLYAGIMSSGVAYTLQIIGQKRTDPTIASLIMSLESVFSTLAGFVLLHNVLSLRELLGCALIFVAIILAQLPMPAKNRQKSTES